MDAEAESGMAVLFGNRDNRHREGDSHGAHLVHYPISAARHSEPSLLNSIRPIAPGKHRVCLAR